MRARSKRTGEQRGEDARRVTAQIDAFLAAGRARLESRFREREALDPAGTRGDPLPLSPLPDEGREPG